MAKQWGLSFSAIQQAMSQKKEHSIGGERIWKKKEVCCQQKEKEEPARESKCLKKKSSTTQSKEVEPEQETTKEMGPEKEPPEVSLGEELHDVSWTKSK